MLRFAPTLSAAAMLTVMLAAAVPFGAEALFKFVAVKHDIVISPSDARLKGPGAAVAPQAKWASWRTLRRG